MFPFIAQAVRFVGVVDTVTKFEVNAFWRSFTFVYSRDRKKNDKPFEWYKEIW